MLIKVLKYDPSIDEAPYYVEGEIEYRDKMTALEALIEFYEKHMPVAYDLACMSRLCGRCAMMLNGSPCLICSMPVIDTDYTFEPLKGFPVVRDLVVDKSVFLDTLSTIYDRVRIEPFNEETITPANYDDSTTATEMALEFCCRCGVCTSGCPAHEMYPDEYAGPAAMVAIAYRHLDQLDTGDRVMEAVSKGLYRCTQCGNCDQVCAQQDINHAALWQMLRSEAEARGIKPSYAN